MKQSYASTAKVRVAMRFKQKLKFKLVLKSNSIKFDLKDRE